MKPVSRLLLRWKQKQDSEFQTLLSSFKAVLKKCNRKDGAGCQIWMIFLLDNRFFPPPELIAIKNNSKKQDTKNLYVKKVSWKIFPDALFILWLFHIQLYSASLDPSKATELLLWSVLGSRTPQRGIKGETNTAWIHNSSSSGLCH